MTEIPIKTGLGQRNLALDILRGMTVAFMVIVNTPGNWADLYAPLSHASWHGFTPTDLVFPTFLFVVGNAMSFSMRKISDMPAAAFFKKVGKRTLLIFLIGWLLNAFPFLEFTDSGIHLVDFTEVRLLGVLQRIALAYFLAAVILYYGGIRLGWIASGALLLGYWGLLYFFGDSGDPYSLTGNAILKLDVLLIGEARLYGGDGIPFDPEGLLSTLPAVVNVLAGYLAGIFIQKHQNDLKVVWGLIILGLILIGLSYGWDVLFPINKKIWSSSYVTLTVGWGLIALAVLIGLTELNRTGIWVYFFAVFGRNPLILYVLSGLLITILAMIPIGDTSLKGYLYQQGLASWLSPKNASFLFAILYMLCIWSIGYWMDKQKIYIKI